MTVGFALYKEYEAVYMAAAAAGASDTGRAPLLLLSPLPARARLDDSGLAPSPASPLASPDASPLASLPSPVFSPAAPPAEPLVLAAAAVEGAAPYAAEFAVIAEEGADAAEFRPRPRSSLQLFRNSAGRLLLT